jgi:cytochrome c553
MIKNLVLTIKTNFIKQKSYYTFQIKKKNLLQCLNRALFICITLTFTLSPIIAKSANTVETKAYLGDANKGEQIAGGICAGCHGSDGNSMIPTNPILAGQHAAYIKKQLHNFQVKGQSEKAMRENAVMVVFASALSDDQIADVAAFYNQQSTRPSYAKNKDLALVGESLYKGGNPESGIPACSSCHGPKGAGIPDQYPRLAGQYTDYTVTTLLAYKNGLRNNNKQMMMISKRMSEEQINAVSEYLAGLR